MAGTTPFELMQSWLGCLALSEDRLRQSGLSISIRERFLGDDGIQQQELCDLRAVASDLRIGVVPGGHELVRLGFRLSGSLLVGSKRVIQLNGLEWSIITPFEVVPAGKEHHVLAQLDSPRRTQQVDAPAGKGPLELALVEEGLRQWADGHVHTHPFLLFGFDAGLGGHERFRFDRFHITTTHAEASPVPPAFVLLLGESTEPGLDRPWVIDPHILPQGQSAVLWLSRRTLAHRDGSNVADAALLALKLRPRAMLAEIPQVSNALQGWARQVIDHVSLPGGGLQFSSMQLEGPPGQQVVMLSATPLSVDELEALRPDDAAQGAGDLVTARAQALLGDCALAALDDNTRIRLLGCEKPELPKEVAELAKPHADWLAEFASLQVALAIKNSPRTGDTPYRRLSREGLERLLRERVSRPACAQLLDGLYPLAFCQVQPRLSLYLEDQAHWLPLLRERLTSDAYIERLLALPEPVQRLHADCAKLSLLGAGHTALDTLSAANAKLMARMAGQHWAAIAAERPAAWERAMELLLTQWQATPPAEGGPALDAARTACGGNRGLATRLAAGMAEERQQAAGDTLETVAARLGQRLALPESAGAAVPALWTYACTAATLMVMMGEAQARGGLAGGAAGMDAALAALAGPFALGASATLALGPLVIEKLPLICNTFAKALRWGANQLASWGKEALSWATTTAGMAFRCVGVALSVVSVGLSVLDAVKDFGSGNIGAGVMDVLQAALSVLSAWAFLSLSAGPLGVPLMIAGLLVAAFAFVMFHSETDEEKAADALVSRLLRLGADHA